MTATAPGKPLPLDETRVVDAAFAVLEDEGFEGLTMRRIADRLGVKNPALYWHFAGKQEIVNGMAVRILGRLSEPPRPADDWRSWLTRAATRLRAELLSHRDGAQVLANANLVRSEQFDNFQHGIAWLAAQGFEAHDAMIGVVAVFDYALGVTYEHQTDARNAAPEEALADADAPAFRSLAGLGRARGADALFEGGLALILDGLALRFRGAGGTMG